MKIAIYIIVLTICFLFLAKVKMSLSPFNIELPAYRYAIGFFLILAGIAFIRYDAVKEGKQEGIAMVMGIIKEQNDKK